MAKQIYRSVAEQLNDNSIDIAESIVQKDPSDIEAFADAMMDQYGIELDIHQSEDLLENCHSAVAEAIMKWANENSLETDPEERVDPDEGAFEPQRRHYGR